jgi:hypothetical protein
MDQNKKKIDDILRKCASLFSNLGMNTPLDVGDIKKAKQLEKEWLQEIKDLDPETYKILVPQNQELET